MFIGSLHLLLRHRAADATDFMVRASNTDWVWTLVPPVILGVVYVVTLLPGPGYSGDTGKFQFIGYVLGTPHEPGYPTYVLLDHFFQLLFPWGTLAYRANLLSAIFTVGAAVVLQRLLVRLEVRPWIAAIVTVTFGLGYAVWSQSVIAEVYTLNLLFVSLVVWFLLRWHTENRVGLLYLACGFYAFSFGNHLTMITFLPAVVYLVWITDKTSFMNPTRIVSILLIICLGAAQYLYLFWRTADPSTAYVEMSAPDLSTFWYFVTGGQFKHLLFKFSLNWMLFDRLPQLQLFGLREMLLLLPFAAYGLTVVRYPKINMFFLLAIGCNVLFCTGYAILDIFAYLIPTYFLLALYAGMGIQALVARVRAPNLAVQMSLLLLPIVALVANYPYAAEQNDRQADQRTHVVLQTAGHNAVIVCPDYNYAHFLWYYVFVESYKDSQIYPVFYHEKKFPAGEVAEYLHNDVPIPVHVTRRGVPAGLKVFLYMRYLEWEMDKLLMYQKLRDADVTKWRQVVVDTTRARFRRLGVEMIERGEDLFELVSSSPRETLIEERGRSSKGGSPSRTGRGILEGPDNG